MYKETWDKKMSETSNIQTCARAGDLVAYLYGEATERETQDFKGHLLVCTSCRTELSDFTGVRESIGMWREQALNPATASFASQFNPAPAQQILEAKHKPSFFDAMRGFFTFSPMWMRGATAFGTLLLATLLVLALMRFFNQAETPIVKQTPQHAPTQEEKTANNPGALKDEVIAVTPKDSPTPAPPVERNKRPKSSLKNLKANGNTVAGNRLATQPKAPVLTAEERTQLSELLIPGNEREDTVPRLSDLLGETN